MTYLAVSRSEALNLAEQGAVLVTHNQRLARASKGEFDARQLAAGRGAWPAPDILSWGAWLARALDDAGHGGGPLRPQLLSPLQEQALWERVIAETPEGRNLLHPAAAAAECREAWSLAHDWDLMPALPAFPKNEDSSAFLAWAERCRSECHGLAATDAARLPALGAELAALGIPAGEMEAAVARAAGALIQTLEDERGRWLLGPRAEARCEWRITGVLDGEIVDVALDRSFVDEQGVRWIVDYKTGTHEGADVDGFLDRERERYAAQLEKYARLMAKLGAGPVRRGLYFPLLRGWREW